MLVRFAALAVVVTGFTCGRDPTPPENKAPVAVGTIPPVTMLVGVVFTANISQFFNDPDGDALVHTAVSSNATVVTASMSGATLNVRALAVGTATVTVTATDPDGESATQTVQFTVARGNQAPVVEEEIDDRTLTEGDTIAVDVSGNFGDPDGDTLTFTAQSGQAGVATVTVAGSEVTIVGVAPGLAVVSVTATDPLGLSATDTFEVTVEKANQAPVAVGEIPDGTLVEGEVVMASVAEFFSDPDGDELIYAATSSDTMVVAASMSADTITVTAVAPGTATITITATDPGGLSATQSADLTVEKANQAPEVADTIPDQTLTEGDTIVLDLSGNFSDPDGDTLTFTAESGDTAVATVSADGSEVTIAGVAPGAAVVSVTATDPGGLSATDTFEVTVEKANQAPVPVSEIAPVTMVEGGEFRATVSRYFSDPDGDELVYAAASSDTAVAAASISGDTMTVQGVAPGKATITVTATDPGGLSATQTAEFTVEKANQAPEVADTIPDQILTEGDTRVLDLSDYFSDPDGDTLTFMARSDDTTAAAVSVDSSELAIAGVAPGSATVSVTATDPGGLSVTQAFAANVEKANQPPVPVDSIPPRTLLEGEEVTLDVTDYFSDPDGDTLTYTAASSDDAVATATADGAMVTIKGVLEGGATVTVTATDPGGLSAKQEIDVTVEEVNEAPEIADTLPVHDIFIVVDDSASDPDTLSEVVLDVSGLFSDPNGDELTYTASTKHDSVAEVESVEGSVVTTVPVEVDSMSLWDSTALTVTATDPDGLSVEQEALVRVARGDYEEWDLIMITDEGKFKLGGSTLELSGCFDLDKYTYGETVYTVHRSEWQMQQGTGWVQVLGTYDELKVCSWGDLPDAPAGTYRLVGEVTTWPADTADTDPGDTVRALRKSANEVTIEEDESPPPPELGAAAVSAPEAGGDPLRPRTRAALTPHRGSGRPHPVPRSRRGCTGRCLRSVRAPPGIPWLSTVLYLTTGSVRFPLPETGGHNERSS